VGLHDICYTGYVLVYHYYSRDRVEICAEASVKIPKAGLPSQTASRRVNIPSSTSLLFLLFRRPIMMVSMPPISAAAKRSKGNKSPPPPQQQPPRALPASSASAEEGAEAIRAVSFFREMPSVQFAALSSLQRMRALLLTDETGGQGYHSLRTLILIHPLFHAHSAQIRGQGCQSVSWLLFLLLRFLPMTVIMPAASAPKKSKFKISSFSRGFSSSFLWSHLWQPLEDEGAQFFFD